MFLLLRKFVRIFASTQRMFSPVHLSHIERPSLSFIFLFRCVCCLLFAGIQLRTMTLDDDDLELRALFERTTLFAGMNPGQKVPRLALP